MRNAVLRVVRSLVAVVAGYMVIVAGTVLAFEVWLGGIGYYKSSFPVLAVASLAALAVGLAGGYVAAWIGGRAPVLHAAGVLVPIILDTTYVISSGVSRDPIWYDLVGASTLMVAAILGGFVRQVISKGRPVLSTT